MNYTKPNNHCGTGNSEQKQNKGKKKLTQDEKLQEKTKTVTALAKQFIQETEKIIGKKNNKLSQKLFDMSRTIDTMSRQSERYTRQKKRDEKQTRLNTNLDNQAFGFGSLDKLTDEIARLSDILTNSETKVEITEKLNELLVPLKDLTCSGKQLMGTLDNFAKVGTGVAIMALLVTLCKLAEYIVRCYKEVGPWMTICGTIVTGICTALYLMGFPQWMKDKIRIIEDWFTRDSSLENQSHYNLASTALSLLFGGLMMFHGKTPESESSYEKFLRIGKNAVFAERIGTSVHNLIEGTQRFVRDAINFIRMKVFGLAPLKLSIEANDAITKWANEVVHICDLKFEGKFLVNEENGRKVHHLRQQYFNFPLGIPQDRWKDLSWHLKSHWEALNALYKEFDNINLANDGPRMEPITICLNGVPGVGKSSATYLLAVEFLKFVLTDAEKKVWSEGQYGKHIFNWSASERRPEGLIRQKIWIIDEMAQHKNTTSTPENSEAMMLMKLINRHPFKTEQAKIEFKGVVYAIPEIIILTTNHVNLEAAFPDIHFVQALERRLTRYTVLPDAKFTENPEEALPKNLTGIQLIEAVEKRRLKSGLKYSTEIYNFHPTSFTGKYEPSRYFTWDQLIDKVKDEHAYRKQKHEEYCEVLIKTTMNSLRSANEEEISECATAQELVNQSGFDDQEDLADYDTEMVDDYITNNLIKVDDDAEEQEFFSSWLKAHNITSVDQIIADWVETHNIWITPEEQKKLSNAILGHVQSVVPEYIDRPDFWRKTAGVIRRGLTSIRKQTADFKTAVSLCSIFSVSLYKRLYVECQSEVNNCILKLKEKTGMVENWLLKWKNTIQQKIDEINACLPSWNTVKMVLTGIACLGMGFYFFDKVLKWWSGNKLVPQMYGKHNKSKQPKPRRRLDAKLVNQAFTDTVTKNIWNKVLRKNLFTIYVVWSDDSLNYLGCGLFVKDTTMLFPYHFILSINEESKLKGIPKSIYIESVRGEDHHELETAAFMNVKRPGSMVERDLCCVSLPLKDNKKDIRGCFVRGVDIKEKTKFDMVLSTISQQGESGDGYEVMPIKSVANLYTDTEVPMPGQSNKTTVRRVCDYRIPTVSGDCGSIVFIENNKSLGKIVGMHIAGRKDGTHGVAHVVTTEEIDEWFPDMQNQSMIGDWIRWFKIPEGPLVMKGDINYAVDQSAYSTVLSHMENPKRAQELLKYWDQGLLLHLGMMIHVGVMNKHAIINDMIERRNDTGNTWELRKTLLCFFDLVYNSHSNRQVLDYINERYKAAVKYFTSNDFKIEFKPIPQLFIGRHDFCDFVHKNLGCKFTQVMTNGIITLTNNVDSEIVDMGIVHEMIEPYYNQLKETLFRPEDRVVLPLKEIDTLAEDLCPQGGSVSTMELEFLEKLSDEERGEILLTHKLPYRGMLVIPKDCPEWNRRMLVNTVARPEYGWPYKQPVNIVGMVASRVSSPRKHDIIRSELFEAYGKTFRKPANLGTIIVDGVEVDPMTRGIKQYSAPELLVDKEVIIACAKNLFRHKANGKPPLFIPRIYTFEEAIAGISDRNLRPIPKNTSPGYPLSLMREGTKGKTKWLGEEEIDWDSPFMQQLKRRVMFKISLMERYEDINVGHFVVDTKKAELRPIEKVDQGKTRIFGSCALEDIIITRMYMGAYHGWGRDYKIENGSAIGINPYSNDWDRLYTNLSKNGWKGFDGDFSQFDAHQSALIHEIILEFIVEPYYRLQDNNPNYEIHARVRRNIIFMMTHSLHICNADYTNGEIYDVLSEGGIYEVSLDQIRAVKREISKDGAYIYQLNSCMPSGHANTTPFNNDYNAVTKRIAFTITSKQPVWYAMDLWDENVVDIDFGDDSITSVSETCSEFFNQHSLPDAYKQIGMIFTPASKSDEKEIPPIRNISDLTFLKRGFRYESKIGRVVAPLELRVVLDMPYWTKIDNSREITEGNVDNTLEELALHGATIFDEWAPKIVKAAYERLHYVPKTTDFDSLLYKVCHREDAF